MSFSYSGNPGSSIRDEVRFLIQDTDSTCALLEDAEIDYVLDKWMPLYDSALYCAAVAAGTVARKWAKVVNVSVGGTSAQVGDLQQRYTEMAAQLKADYHAEGDVGGLVNLENILAGTEFDPTIEPLQFSIGLDDNPYAGSQNYGGRIGRSSYSTHLLSDQ
jgi:hypothetical protein